MSTLCVMNPLVDLGGSSGPKGPTYVIVIFILLCSSQTRLQPLPVQTQGTQLLKLFIQVYYNNSHQQYENVTNEVSHSSMFKITVVVNHIMYKIELLRQYLRQLGQLYCNWL